MDHPLKYVVCLRYARFQTQPHAQPHKHTQPHARTNAGTQPYSPNAHVPARVGCQVMDGATDGTLTHNRIIKPQGTKTSKMRKMAADGGVRYLHCGSTRSRSANDGFRRQCSCLLQQRSRGAGGVDVGFEMRLRDASLRRDSFG